VALTDGQFERISSLVMAQCGINLHVGKKEMVRARLNKRLRALRLEGFEQYVRLLGEPGGDEELVTMLDTLSTNVTQFFREPRHFQFLGEELAKLTAGAAGGGRVRIWSAGCSMGQEPYSIAMTLCEQASLARWDCQVLATDLSTRALRVAVTGSYSAAEVAGVPRPLLNRYFADGGKGAERRYAVRPVLRERVQFARLNLMSRWPMRGPFDVVFCRNVMIYFDKPTQGRLVERFSGLLRPGGLLLVGHSESLAGVRHGLKYEEPTIYRKPA
jgi:chemotaxis protein methyltransferase CheR